MARRVKQAGYQVAINGNGHYEVRDQEGHLLYVFPGTPSEYRFRINTEADLKRLGIFTNGGKKEGEKMEATTATGIPVDEIALRRARAQRVEATWKAAERTIAGLEQHVRGGTGAKTRFAEKMVELTGENPPGNAQSALTMLLELSKGRGSDLVLHTIEQTVSWFDRNPITAVNEILKKNEELEALERERLRKTTEKARARKSDSTRVSCEVCGMVYKNKAGLSAHIRAAHTPKATPKATSERKHVSPLHEISKKVRADLLEAIAQYGFTPICMIAIQEAQKAGLRASAGVSSAQSSLRRLLAGEPVDAWVLDQFRAGMNAIERQHQPVEEAHEEQEAPQVEEEIQMPEEGVETVVRDLHPISEVLDLAFDTMGSLLQKGVGADTTLDVGRQLIESQLKLG